MKRFIASLWVLCFTAICLFSACGNEASTPISTSEKSATMGEATETTSTTINKQNQQTTNISNLQEDIEENDVGGGIITVQKYRSAFYSVPAPFVDLIDRSVYFGWEESIDITSTAETMVMSQFVQYFGITREQFDKANLEWAKIVKDKLYGVPCINPKDYANQEHDEIYNADIIFTFDDDLIREYYLSPDYQYIYDIEFEQAVASGEYTPRTEVWIDVEEMEAEIIAKYGEAENVTEPINPQEVTWPPTTEGITS